MASFNARCIEVMLLVLPTVMVLQKAVCKINEIIKIKTMVDLYCMIYFTKSFQLTTVPLNFSFVLRKSCSLSKAATLPPIGVRNSLLLKKVAFEASIKLWGTLNFTR